VTDCTVTLQVGFMQGRLSPKPRERVQAFPKDSWREEFSRARQYRFHCIELIFDVLYLEDNPLASEVGRRELVSLAEENEIRLHSICADYFMERPLSAERHENVERAKELLHMAHEIGCPVVEFPFVDASSLLPDGRIESAAGAIEELADSARELGIGLALETDLPPVVFRDFLDRFPRETVGANLDLGNSASLGYDPFAECRAFGSRIVNVHVKDRPLGGGTVPLTTGDVDFASAFRALAEHGYRGDFILQTAPDDDYLAAARRYREMVEEWIERYLSGESDGSGA